jgi:hypothetical protein
LMSCRATLLVYSIVFFFFKINLAMTIVFPHKFRVN